MARSPRIVIPGAPHHVTQRGSRGQEVFFSDSDQLLYLDLLEFYCRKYETYLISFSLMINHIHHIAVPTRKDGLRLVFGTVHQRYAEKTNKRMGWTGHLWQERFFSCPLDLEHFWAAISYVERNPVEAGLVAHPSDYRWSSAAAHCGLRHEPALFYPAEWESELRKVGNWHNWLDQPEPIERITRIQECTESSLPCGSDEFLTQLEFQTTRSLKLKESSQTLIKKVE